MGEPQRPRRGSLDAFAGLRVGVVTGALLGALVSTVVGVGHLWLIPLGGAVGGAIGRWSQRRTDDAGPEASHPEE